MINLPNITDEKLDDAKQRKQIKNYLYQLTEQLRYMLNNLEVENFTPQMQESLSRMEKNAQKVGNIEIDLEETRNEIVQKADQITNEYRVELETGLGLLRTQVAEEYTAKSETAALQQTLESKIEQTSNDITLSFDQANTYTIEVDGKLQEFIDEIKSYQRFTAEGIELGEVNSPFLAKLGNTRLSFLQNGVEIAYISNNKMYITDLEVQGKITQGNSVTGYFDWLLEANGSLSLTRREI